jgi:triacylglycerol lipase
MVNRRWRAPCEETRRGADVSMRFRSTGMPRDGAASGRSALAVAAREVLAFARQGLLLRHDTAEPVIPRAVEQGDDVVVFLHGLFATAGVLRPLRSAVARHTFLHTAALTYFPGPGVAAIAERIRALVAAIPEGARLHLVGHSLGGIVMRYFALESGDPRVVQTISLAAPFGGVARAAWLGLDAGRDLRPQSAVLRRILVHPDAARVPHLSIIAAGDTVVDSPIAHALPGGDVLVMPGLGHNTLLFDDEVARAVEARILERRRPSPRTAVPRAPYP